MAKRNEPEGALYVKLPSDAVDRLHRAAEVLGVHKKVLVAGLVNKYVDPDNQRSMSALGGLPPRPPYPQFPQFPQLPQRDEHAPIVGTHTFERYDDPDEPEVLTLTQTAKLLQVDDKTVLELAEAGELPGRKIGKHWRFSRAAVLAWLAGD